jgi:glucose/mannose-6-phosphate isomerase
MDGSLDDLKRIKVLDESGMLQVLKRFPEDCRSAIKRAKKASLKGISGERFTKVVFAGVGGSSIGGKLVVDWLRRESAVPLVISRGYHLPAFVDDETLVFTISYSGNTEETLSMLSESLRAGAPTITVTSGGRIGEISKEKGLSIIPLPDGYRPRAAISHQFFSLATTMHELDLVGTSWGEVPEALSTLEAIRDEVSMGVPTDNNLAKKVALRLRGKLPLVYGSSLLEGVAYRFGTQLNENSKVPSGSGGFPEVFHNAVLGSEWDSEALGNLALVLLRDRRDDGGVKRKIERFKGLFAPKIGDIIEVEARGSGRLSRILSLVYLGDYISTYLGLLYGHDPSSNISIDKLKQV